MQQLQHEPETKAFNKARDFQDALIRAKRAGARTPREAVSDLRNWYADASGPAQEAFMEWAAARMWDTTEAKLAPVSRPSLPPLSAKQRAAAKERGIAMGQKIVADALQAWFDRILPMTKEDVEAAHMLPPDLVAAMLPGQKVGEKYTHDQLAQYGPKP